MKTFQTWSVAVFALLLLFASAVLAQLPSLQQELSLQNTRSLSFGGFVAGSGGSVTLSPGGERSAAGSVVLVPSDNGQSAQFTVEGEPDATYFIDLPADSSVVLTGPGADMTLTDFTSEPSGAGGQLNSAGSQTLSVGATLHVQDGQTAGSYSGSFSVTVDYN